MSVRRILTIDNAADLAVLKQVSTPVEGPVTDELRALMDDMLETMYAAPGIGLAAVQIGDTRRVIVMDLGDRGGAADDLDPADMSDDELAKRDAERRNPRFFVNPEIVWESDELFTYEEGCLSVPEYFDSVERPARVRLKYLNYEGQTVEEEAEGVLFIDHLSRLKRERAVARVRKNARLAA
jgi:peptide deformylase